MMMGVEVASHCVEQVEGVGEMGVRPNQSHHAPQPTAPNPCLQRTLINGAASPEDRARVDNAL